MVYFNVKINGKGVRFRVNNIMKFLCERLKSMNTYSKILFRAGLQLTCLIYLFGILVSFFGDQLGRFVIVGAYSDGALEIAPVVLGASIVMAFIYDIVLANE